MVRCACCQHRGKGCPPDCIFIPHFQNREIYGEMHAVFGFSNIHKWMLAATLDERASLASALAWEARNRVTDPVQGSHGIHLQDAIEKNILEQQISNLQRENAELIQQLNAVQGHNAELVQQLNAAVQVPQNMVNAVQGQNAQLMQQVNVAAQVPQNGVIPDLNQPLDAEGEAPNALNQPDLVIPDLNQPLDADGEAPNATGLA